MRQTVEDEAAVVPRQSQLVNLDETTRKSRMLKIYKRWKIRERWISLALQVMRFALVGGLNTALDLLIFNAFLLLLPTKNTILLLSYNSTAYALGSINSFIFNKYWTFRHEQKTTRGEVLRFMITTLLDIGWNDLIIWLISGVSHPLIADARLWVNVSKVCAIFGTVLISFLGMRLWVFVKPSRIF